MKRFTTMAVITLAVVFFAGSTAMARGKATHRDMYKNPRGCSACHSGSGVPGTPLLKETRDRICFNCHGSVVRGRAVKDVEEAFAKKSIHPIFDTARYHRSREDLPERMPSATRHVACSDCHKVHISQPSVPWAGAKGYSRARERLKKAKYEYELCYLCHSDSENLPTGSTNKREEFDPTNASYHPVESAGRNRFMPSLVRGLNVNKRIACSDCHGNNDPMGAQGPHGSDYEPLLVAKYTVDDGQESPKAYELCYMCHDRRSILSDQSFKRHKMHIVFAGTSCYTCHNSHGVRVEPHLIEFNPDVVTPSNSTGMLMYLEPPASRCYLSCHGVDHNEALVGVVPWPW